MSLYNDLNTVLTPYAERIKGNTTDIAQINTNMVRTIANNILGEPLSDYEWAQGEIKNNTGTNGSSAYYIRVNDYIHVYAGDVIHFDMVTYPYKYIMFFYTDAAPATWTGERTLLDNSVENYTIESECYIRLKLNPNPSRTVTADDKVQMPGTIKIVRAGSASAILNTMNTDIGIAKTEALAVSEDFEHVIDKMCETSALEWYKAYVKPNGSTGSTSKNLVTGFVYMRDYTFVDIETGNYDIEFEVCFYNENKAFVSRESLLSKGVTSYHKQFKGKGYLRVVFSRLDRGVLTDDDITHIRNCITVKTLKNTDKYEPMLIQMNRRWNGTGASGGQYNSKNKILTLAHFSDIHADAKTFGDMVSWFHAYDKYLTDVICTGDIVYDVFSTGYEFWTRLAGTENIMYVLGNHEQNSGGGFNNALSEPDAYDMYFDGKASVWGVTLPQGKTYWYKDYQDEKIRMIGINSNYAVPNFFDSTEGAAQYAWFVETLEGARTNGLSVLVLSHIRPYDSDGHVVDCNFSMIGRGGGTPTIVNEIHSAINDFVAAGGEFIGFLVGHTHGDDIWQCGTYPDQYAFCVTCATCYGYYSDQDRILDTESEMAFNVVSIDTSAKIIKIMRVGADVDSYMRSRKYLTWDYQSHRVITSG